MRVRQRPRAVVLGAALLAVSLGCVEARSGAPQERRPEAEVADLVIDAGAAVELEPGEGVGLAVEYDGDGAWRFTVSCDTLESDLACRFDVVCSTDDSAGVTELRGVGLEVDDDVYWLDDYAIQADLIVGVDADSVDFFTTPGATVRFSALLYDSGPDDDWVADPRMISWVGGGGLHWGAPTNPLDLTPDRP